MGMMYFQVEEDKVEKISDHLEKGLRYIGKAMQCVDDMMQGGSMNERGNYSEGMGYREDDDEVMNERMGYRRGVRGTGPYSRINHRMPMPPYREPYMM